MTLTSLLAPYEALVQEHQAQFSPQLEQLRTSVTTTLHQLQPQEQALVAAQRQQLEQIHQQLATDARCLLDSVELPAFVTEVNTFPPRQRWNLTELIPELDPNPQHWQLAQRDLAISIRDYAPVVDHNAYDDERTYTTYGYRVTISLNHQPRSITVITHCVYSPVKQQSDNQRQQLDDCVEPEVADLLKVLELEAAMQAQLSQEISYLLGCAARILALTPTLVQFHYSSAEVAE